MSSLGKNILSNFGMQAVVLVTQLVLLPFYVRLLGMEAYAWVGVYVSLQGLFVMMDLGMSTTINQLMARLSGQKEGRREAADVLRTFEMVYWMTGSLMFLLVWFLVPFITRNWSGTGDTSGMTCPSCVLWIAVLVVLRFPVSFYSGALNGLQLQFNMNAMLICLEFVKAACIVAGIRFVNADIRMFFWVSIGITLLTILGLRGLIRHKLELGWRDGEFRWRHINENWRFSLGVSLVTLAAVAVSQADKIMLGRLVGMRDFSLYAMAFSIGSIASKVSGSIASAYYPLLVQKKSCESNEGLAAAYHGSCQAISVLVLPLVILSVLFMPQLLSLWFGDAGTAEELVPLVRIIMAGFAVNGLVTMPYYLQLAHQWTRLSFFKNMVAILLLLPGLYFAVQRDGIHGAVWIWLILNCLYFIFEVPVMHARILRKEQMKYYWQDTGLILLASSVFSGFSWLIVVFFEPEGWLLLLMLLVSGLLQVYLLNFLSSERPLDHFFQKVNKQAL